MVETITYGRTVNEIVCFLRKNLQVKIQIVFSFKSLVISEISMFQPSGSSYDAKIVYTQADKDIGIELITMGR